MRWLSLLYFSVAMDQHSFPQNSHVHVPLDPEVCRTSCWGEFPALLDNHELTPLHLTMLRKEGREGLFWYFNYTLNESNDLSSGRTN